MYSIQLTFFSYLDFTVDIQILFSLTFSHLIFAFVSHVSFVLSTTAKGSQEFPQRRGDDGLVYCFRSTVYTRSYAIYFCSRKILLFVDDSLRPFCFPNKQNSLFLNNMQ